MKKILLSITAVVALGTTSFAQLDTLSEYFTGTPTIYGVDAVLPADSGFISGNNAFGDKAKIMKFDGLNGAGTAGGFVKGALLAIPIKNNINNGSIDVKMWAWGSATALGAELASVTIPLSAIDTAVSAFAIANGMPHLYNVTATFPTPVAIPANGMYMIGVVLPANTAGQVALLTNTAGDFAAAATNSFEMWDDNTLHLIPAAWGASVKIAMAIYPVVNYSVGLDELSSLEASVYPNPANDVLNFGLNGVEVSTIAIYGLDGKLIVSQDVNATTGKVDVASMKSGMYIYEITSANGNVVKNTFVKN